MTLVGSGIGTFVGVINGMLVAKVGVKARIVTLDMITVIRELVLW